MAGQSTTTVTVTQGGQTIAPVILPVAPSSAAIFTQDGTGVGQALAFNQDQSLNTPVNPAAEGSVISMYVTGAGQTNPQGQTGTVPSDGGGLVLPVIATIAGLPAEVVYSGPAPGVVAGVSQVNLRVPVGASSMPMAPVSIQIGNTVTQDGVLVSLH